MPAFAGSSEASSQASSQASSEAAKESGGSGNLVPPSGAVRYSPSGVYVQPPTPKVTSVAANKAKHKHHRVGRSAHQRQH